MKYYIVIFYPTHFEIVDGPFHARLAIKVADEVRARNPGHPVRLTSA